MLTVLRRLVICADTLSPNCVEIECSFIILYLHSIIISLIVIFLPKIVDFSQKHVLYAVKIGLMCGKLNREADEASAKP